MCLSLPFWSPPGEISEHGCWALWVGPALYTGPTRRAVWWAWLCGDDRDVVG